MIKKLYHSADWHLRLKKRHNEAGEAFDALIKSIETDGASLAYNEKLIIIAGDLFHQFDSASNEAYIIMTETLKRMSKICKVVIIAGNHDFNEENKNSVDTILPVINAMDNDNIHYLRDSSCYEIEGIHFAVYSVFENCKRPYFDGKSEGMRDTHPDWDESRRRDMIDHLKGKNIWPIIGLFHAPIVGAKDEGYLFEEGTAISQFESCHAIVAGDIHMPQTMYYNGIPVVYSGSLFQQGYGESVYGHGHVVWDVDHENQVLTPNFVEIDTAYGYYKVGIKSFEHAEKGNFTFLNAPQGPIKDKAKVRIIWEDFYHNITPTKKRMVRKLFAKDSGVDLKNIDIDHKYILKDVKESGKSASDILDAVLNKAKLRKSYGEYLKGAYKKYDLEAFNEIDDTVNSLIEQKQIDFDNRDRSWKILWFGGENLLSFADFYHDLRNTKGITLISSFPENQGGKSNLLNIVKILIFGSYYHTNGTKSKLEKLFNRFMDVQTAFVEGELEIGGEVYYLKRTLKKQKSGKAGHSFEIYRYDENFKTKVNGRFAENLKAKDAVKSLKKFEKNIGSIHDYMYTSDYTSTTIDKWIETKPTERFKLFSDYLGLGLLEEKYGVANDLYKAFVKDSEISKSSLADLETLIENNNLRVEELGESKEGFLQEIKSTQEEMDELEKELHEIYEKKISVPESIIGKNTFELEMVKETQREGLSKMEAKIEPLKQSLGKFLDLNNSPASLLATAKGNMSSLREQMANIEIPEKMLSELERLEKLRGFVVPTDKKEEIAVIDRKLLDLRAEYLKNNGQVEHLKKQLEAVPPKITCEWCEKEISDGTQQKEALLEQIEQAKLDLSQTQTDGVKLKTRKLELENTIGKEETEHIKTIDSQIQSQKVRIESFRQSVLEGLKEDYNLIEVEEQRLNGILNKQNEYKILLGNIDLQKKNLDRTCEDITLVEQYSSSVETNAVLDNEITQKKSEKKLKGSILLEAMNDMENVKRDIDQLNLNTSQAETKIELLRKDFEKEENFKLYLEVHGKSGIAKHMIYSILPRINSDLQTLLEPLCDFSLLIEFGDKGIEFKKEKRGVLLDLYETSGLERTISCLALHYVNMKISTLPIPNIIVLDEIFGRVHKTNHKNAYAIVKKMLDVFEHVIFITHHDEIKEWADNHIQVEKNLETDISKIIRATKYLD